MTRVGSQRHGGGGAGIIKMPGPMHVKFMFIMLITFVVPCYFPSFRN
jgi:hypothetical protein